MRSLFSWRPVAAAFGLAALLAGGVTDALGQSNPGASAPFLAKSTAGASLRLDPGLHPPTLVDLGAVSISSIDAAKRANGAGSNKRLQIGVPLKVAASAKPSSAALKWTPVAGGMASQWEISSTGTRALRVALDVARLPLGSEIRFAGRGDSSRTYGPFTSKDVRAAGTTYWSPVLEGDRAIVEVFLAGNSTPADVAIEVLGASSLFVSPLEPKAESLAKAAGACEVNLICRSATDAALANTGRSVARMTFVEGGATYLCTGTLLNPADGTFTPYFYSANHCINTQDAASTLTTYWFYDSTTCTGSTTSPSAIQQSGGATLLFASESSDAMLMRLNNTPPGNAFFSGWNADTLPVGSALTAVHHPEGDLKKVSLGTVSGFGTPSGETASFVIARWTSTATGVTEGGSSGSGIFTAIGQPASSYQFRGGLLGGPSSCTAAASDLVDYYSRFDQAYPYVAMYLNPASTSCSYSVSPSTQLAAGAGDSGTIAVTAQTGCPWAATSTASWITASATGSGNGSASYTVDANDSGSTRTGSVLIGGRAVTITQPVPPSTGTNVVANPGFESGSTGWTEVSTPGLPIITTDSRAHTGSGYAWLGGYTSGTDTLTQGVTIPAGAVRATLSFWYRIESAETSTAARDTMTVALLSASGSTLATLQSYSNLDDTNGVWVRSQAFDVSAYRGQSVRLQFRATNDSANPSSFLVDDIALNAVTNNYTALWWNPNESGWGVNLVHQGDIVFATMFNYDASGHGMWLVMSNGAKQAGSDTFSGTLYRTVGPAFNASPFTPITNANYTPVGTMTVAFSGTNAATLTYNVGASTVTKAIQKLVYGLAAADCEATTGSRAGLTNYQDLWWNAAESGWGINVTHQGDILFATLFTYDNATAGNNNQGLWLVMSSGQKQADGSYLGDLFQTVGPPFDANPFPPITNGNYTRVGTMRMRFSDGEHGQLDYTVNGAPVSKAITRLVFSSPVPACSG